MTIELLHPDDSGEITRLPGEARIRIDTADLHSDETGEKTQNLGRYAIHASVVGAIPRKVIEIDDTVMFHIPETIGLAGPQSPPPPLPPPPSKYAPETERLTLLGTVAGIDGELRPSDYVGRHRDPWDRVAVLGEGAWERMVEAAKPAGEPRRLRVQVGVGAFVFLLAAVTVAVLRVFW